MKSPITTLTASTLIIAAVFIIVYQFNDSFNATILPTGDYPGNVLSHKTLTWKIYIPDKATIIQGMAFEPYYVRLSLPDGKIWHLDRHEKKIVLMNPSKKTAKITSIEDQPPDLYDTLSVFKNMSQLPVEYIGSRKIDEIHAIGFLESIGHDQAVFWINPQTRLPIRIEFFGTNEWDQTKPVFIWSDIVFDVELDRSLFSYDIEQYKVEEVNSTREWQNYLSIAYVETNVTL